MSLSFLAPVVLAGAALIAVPIVIHLILKKKPKHLIFPAFRFLQQKHRTTTQKLRLRHLLLLALRVLLLLAACFALARPLLSGGPAELATDAPLAAVILFDTSASMDYEMDGKPRLEQAKEMVLRWLDYLPASSQVTVMDSAEPGLQFTHPRDAAQQVRNRRVQPLNRPITASLEEAYRALEKTAPDLPLVVCVFSDRTAASWNAEAARTFVARSKVRAEERLGRTILGLYVDVGPTEPRNAAIVGIALQPGPGEAARPLEAIPHGTMVTEARLQATIRVTGTTVDSDVLLYVDGRLADVQRINRTAEAGKTATEVVTFKPIQSRRDQPDQLRQGEVRLKAVDLLPADNVRYWTLASQVRNALVIADRPEDARPWRLALESLPNLPLSCQETVPARVPGNLHPDQFQVVSLLNVARPDEKLWETLDRYVKAGGGLIVLPGGDSVAEAYSTPAALRVLPGRLTRILDVPPPGTFLAPTDYDHAVAAYFKDWEKQTIPGYVTRFWEVVPTPDLSRLVLPYEFEGRPALLERVFDGQQVLGRVLLFTTAVYQRTDRSWKDWNTFHETWMALGLPYVMARHVTGARDERQNFVLRDDVRFWLPQGSGFSSYALTGPASVIGEVKPNQTQVAVTEARRPGNYKVSDPGGETWRRFFSVNLPAEETNFVDDRPDVEEIAAVLGPGSVHRAQDVAEVSDLTRAALGQSPRSELLPYVMIAVVLLLAGENFLANRFYKRVET